MAKICTGEEQLDGVEGQIVELKYYILEQKVFYEDLNEELTAYGLEIEKRDNTMTETSKIEDITCNKKEIDEITRMLKDNKVLPVHLNDVVLDMLS